MYIKRKAIFISSIFLICLLAQCSGLIKPSSAQVSSTLVRSRVQYGYWEITPVIDNILKDWSVSLSTSVSGGTVSAGSNPTYLNPQIFASRKDTTIDPDGNQYSFWTTKSAVSIGLPSANRNCQIYRSAPATNFALGEVYLSDYQGNHWSRLGYNNFTSAMSSLANWQIIQNYEQNTTYVYREIPYSFKVCFWTQGMAHYTTAPTNAWLFRYYYQSDDWFNGIDGAVFQPDKSYKMYYDFCNASYVDTLPVTAMLDLKIIAPLWTSSATQTIQSPDGTWKANYDNTWIGMLGAKVSGIHGGIIDASIDPSTVQGTVDQGATATARKTPDNYTGSRGQTAVIEPVPSQTAVAGSGTSKPAFTNTANPTQQAVPSGLPDGAIAKVTTNGGFPNVVADNIVLDPDVYESYFLSASTAQGAVLGQYQDEYLVQWNSSYYDPRNPSTLLNQYSSANANYINQTIISDIKNVDRTYSSSLSLDKDIPNELDVTLGATMRPALHSWYKNVHWTEKDVSRIAGFFGDQHFDITQNDNVLKVLAGQEVINVYITYTITFTVVMIDKYNQQRIPSTNLFAGDDLYAWVKQQLHNNSYEEYWNWQYQMYSVGGSTANVVLIIGVVAIVALWIYWFYTAYKTASRSGGHTKFWREFTNHWIMKLVITAIVIVLIIVLPLIMALFNIFRIF